MHEVTGGTGADVVIEATGEAGPVDIAAALCRALITHVLPLAEIGRAFELADQREADFFKAVITMNGASGGRE